jgi:hypothetical protein
LCDGVIFNSNPFQEDDDEAFKKQFSTYIKKGITADSVIDFITRSHQGCRIFLGATYQKMGGKY